MSTKIDKNFKKNIHALDKDFEKFRREMEKKYGIFICRTGSIEYNSLTLLLTAEDAKKIHRKDKYKEWLRSRP